ncbi:MAG: helix-turn-helix domain-containing protein [Chloroflexi bacterium]|nr:helix-turn-helix domain-containing protein [Chloroflexota bacterium]
MKTEARATRWVAPTDRLPDYSEYHDQGCDLSPSCLKCPLPKCRHDVQVEGKRGARLLRDRAILRQRSLAGKSVAELATEFDLSKRTIQRIIRRLSNE